jgi:hypothetical protein
MAALICKGIILRRQTMKNTKSYAALHMLSFLYHFLAGGMLLLGLIGGGVTLFTPTYGYYGSSFNLVQGLTIIIPSILASISFAAFAQIIQVVLEMLENSRAQTRYLRHLTRQ